MAHQNLGSEIALYDWEKKQEQKLFILIMKRSFLASRWTTACREWEEGGTARDPVSWERGDEKIKQKRNTIGSGGK